MRAACGRTGLMPAPFDNEGGLRPWRNGIRNRFRSGLLRVRLPRGAPMASDKQRIAGLRTLVRAARRALERARKAPTCKAARHEATQAIDYSARAVALLQRFRRPGREALELLASAQDTARKALIRQRWTCQREAGEALARAHESGVAVAYRGGRRVEVGFSGQGRDELLELADLLVPLYQHRADDGGPWRGWRADLASGGRYAGSIQVVTYVFPPGAGRDGLLQKILNDSPPPKRDKGDIEYREEALELARDGGVTASNWHPLRGTGWLTVKALRLFERLETWGCSVQWRVNVVVGRRLHK